MIKNINIFSNILYIYIIILLFYNTYNILFVRSFVDTIRKLGFTNVELH